MPRTISGAAGLATGAVGAVAVAARGAAIASHLQRVDPRRFRQLIAHVELALACVRDVVRGHYRLPWKTIAALSAALAYFLSPVDAIPDFIPLSGFIDDAAVLGMVLGAAEADLRRYCAWRGLDPEPYFETTAEARGVSGRPSPRGRRAPAAAPDPA